MEFPILRQKLSQYLFIASRTYQTGRHVDKGVGRNHKFLSKCAFLCLKRSSEQVMVINEYEEVHLLATLSFQILASAQVNGSAKMSFS
jgi:hypothetical protein